jgi:hypothetical protein
MAKYLNKKNKKNNKSFSEQSKNLMGQPIRYMTTHFRGLMQALQYVEGIN